MGSESYSTFHANPKIAAAGGNNVAVGGPPSGGSVARRPLPAWPSSVRADSRAALPPSPTEAGGHVASNCHLQISSLPSTLKTWAPVLCSCAPGPGRRRGGADDSLSCMLLDTGQNVPS